MRLTGHGLVALTLAAWAASLVSSDARQRGAKPPNAGRHMSAPAGGPAKVRAPAPAITPFTNRNAIGVTTAPGGFSPPKAVLPTITAPNVTGARPSTFGSAPATKIGPGAGATTFVRSAAPTPPHGGGISGTGMTHPGMSGVVGGPAKFAGGISGTGMKPKK